MKTVLTRIGVLLSTLALLFVLGCSYAMENAQTEKDQGISCAKFASNYTPEERSYCSRGN